MNRFNLAILVALLFVVKESVQDDIIGCGGFIKSNTEINYKIIKVKLLTKDGSVKYTTESSPVNGYYMIPIYNKGEYILQVNPPPGWSFEPNEVNINVDGQTDPCSRNEDINFFFKGFGLSGKVVTYGDPKNNGPSGVKLNLISNDKVIDSTISSAGGSYYFSNVMPGAYQVEAQHSTIKFIQNKVSVVLSKENWSAKDNIIVSGYKIEGLVTTADKSPLKGVQVDLHFNDESFAKIDTKNFVCNFDKTKQAGSLRICSVRTNDQGRFTFSNVIFGKYKLTWSLSSGENMVFNMKPDLIQVDLTKHEDVSLISTPFVLDSVDLTSQVLSSKDKPLENAEIFLNGEKIGTSGKNGAFSFKKLTTGNYKISIKSQNIYFEEKLINIDLSSPSCLQKDASQHQKLLSLTKFFAKSFDVCGKVTVVKDQSNSALISDLKKSVQIKCYQKQDASSNELKLVKSVGLDDQFRYCLVLDVNVDYVIKAELNDRLSQVLRLVPIERKLRVIDSPIMNIDFEQLEAKLEGKILILAQKLDSVKDFSVTMKSADTNWSKKVDIKCTEPVKVENKPVDPYLTCTFSLTNLLFGNYLISTNYDDLICWKNPSNQADKSGSILININSEIQNVQIEQTGYRLNYRLSHKNALLKLTDEKNTNEILFTKNILNDKDLSGSVCLPNAKNYKLEIQSCHKYTNSPGPVDYVQIDSGLFKKNSNSIELKASKHEIQVDVVFKYDNPAEKSKVTKDDLYVLVRDPANQELGRLKFTIKSDANNEIVFTSKSWFGANQKLYLSAKSEKILFEQVDKELVVNEDNCASNYVKFEAKLGIFIVGKINPSDIDSINLVLKSVVNNEELERMIVNSATGFKLGPLRAPASQYDVELEKPGFLFSKVHSETDSKDVHQINFNVEKLGQLKVNVIESVSKTNLEGVLLSLTSENRLFRNNVKTDSNGHASFDNLKPGLYYLILMMQEYEFKPNSHPIQITDGFHLNLDVEAVRIAYSCFGKVTSINGLAISDNIEVEARGVQADPSDSDEDSVCSTSRESSVVDSFGSYRIRNLKPKCVYELTIKYSSQESANLKLVPEKHLFTVGNSDVQDKNFILFDPIDKCDLTLAISYRSSLNKNLPIDYKQVNNFVRVKLFRTSQPDSVIQTQYAPANSIVYFNDLQRDQSLQYSVQIELLLPSSVLTPFSVLNQAQQSQLNQQPALEKTELSFYADSAHKHLSVSFDFDKKQSNSYTLDPRQQQYQNFYFTLPLFIIFLGVLLYSKSVQAYLNQVISGVQQKGSLLKYIQSLMTRQAPPPPTAPSGTTKSSGKSSAYHQQKPQSKESDNEGKSKPSPRGTQKNVNFNLAINAGEAFFGPNPSADPLDDYVLLAEFGEDTPDNRTVNKRKERVKKI